MKREPSISQPAESARAGSGLALDDVVLGPRGGASEAIDRKGRDVDERLTIEDEVAHDLADGRALEEAVA